MPSRRGVLGSVLAGLASLPGLGGGSVLCRAQADPFTLTGTATQGGWMRGHVPVGTVALLLDGKPLAFAEDGAFFLAFDRDAPAAARLVAQDAKGVETSRVLTIAPRAWRIEHVDAPRHPPGLPDEEFARRRAIELARIAAARAHTNASDGWRQTMIRPAPGPITGRFGAQRIYRGEPGAYHSGMDIAAAAGSPFHAPADGVVVLAATPDPFTLEGHLVLVDHGMGLSSAMLHAQALFVAEGDIVRQGHILGHVGMSGRATGPHLHWGLTWQGRRLDPLLFIQI